MGKSQRGGQMKQRRGKTGMQQRKRGVEEGTENVRMEVVGR